MWCGKCQADVAAEVSPDNQRVFCTVCGALLSTIDLPPTRPIADKVSDRTKDARQLLQRWSSGQLIDPFGPPTRGTGSTILASPQPEALAAVHAEVHQPAAVERSSFPSVPVVAPPVTPTVAVETPAANSVAANIALAFSTAATQELLAERPSSSLTNPLTATLEPARPMIEPSPNPLVAPSATTSSMPAPTPTVAVVPSHPIHRVDAAHPMDHFVSAKTAVAPPADAVGPFASKGTAAETKRESRRPLLWFPTWDPAVWRSEPSAAGNWSSMAGQLLAYTGVLGMTAGACLVVWSYFGGPANYAPTGWVLLTAGQMLLFFGVVTLVSGGLEHTTEQVNKRIEQLGDHIIRIEQAAREMSLRGAVPPAHFGNDPDAAVPTRSAASTHERSIVEE